MKITKQFFILFLTIMLGTTANLFAESVKPVIRQDGTFDIIGSTIKITNCYPAFESRSIKPISVVSFFKGSKFKEKCTLLRLHF